jgi:hypothetical protein
LQDDTSVIREMLRGYRADCDIVYGVRKERKTDSAFKRNTDRKEKRNVGEIRWILK